MLKLTTFDCAINKSVCKFGLRVQRFEITSRKANFRFELLLRTFEPELRTGSIIHAASR